MPAQRDPGWRPYAAGRRCTAPVSSQWRVLCVATAQAASLIVLVPGYQFTLAVKEIATANLVSGAARMTSALGDFLALGFGVAIGTRLAGTLIGSPRYTAPEALPAWVVAWALAAATLGFAVRFRAHRRDFVWVALACLGGYLGARLGTLVLGGQLGAFVGALVVGLASNSYARHLRRSPLVMMVPGIMLLVPGSFRFRSFDLLLRHDVVSGIETAFDMALVATALSTGLLLSNLLLPGEQGVAAVRRDPGAPAAGSARG